MVFVAFERDDFLRIWKGLFYTIWMSDKPLIQEECAEKIAQLINHCCDPNKACIFFQTGLETLRNEWFGIDQLRLDKFLMFVRRFMRQAFVFLNNHSWPDELVTKFTNALSDTVLDNSKSVPLGLTMQITEVYLEELAKVLGSFCSYLHINWLISFDLCECLKESVILDNWG